MTCHLVKNDLSLGEKWPVTWWKKTPAGMLGQTAGLSGQIESHNLSVSLHQEWASNADVQRYRLGLGLPVNISPRGRDDGGRGGKMHANSCEQVHRTVSFLIPLRGILMVGIKPPVHQWVVLAPVVYDLVSLQFHTSNNYIYPLTPPSPIPHHPKTTTKNNKPQTTHKNDKQTNKPKRLKQLPKCKGGILQVRIWKNIQHNCRVVII